MQPRKTARLLLIPVIPAKAGFQNIAVTLDPCFGRDDAQFSKRNPHG
jgi:hypothetical protein